MNIDYILGPFVFEKINRIFNEKFYFTFLIITVIIFLICIIFGHFAKPLKHELSIETKIKKDKKKKKKENVELPLVEPETTLNKDMGISTSKFESEDKKVKTLADKLHIFIDPIFMFVAISNLILNLGFKAPYMFVYDQSLTVGLEKKQAELILYSIGISSMLGKLMVGILCWKINNRIRLWTSILLLFCGIVTIIEPFIATGFVGLLAFSIIFGFTSGNLKYFTHVYNYSRFN